MVIIRFLLFTAVTGFLLLLLARPKRPKNLEEYIERQGKTPLMFSDRSGFYSEDVLLELDTAQNRISIRKSTKIRSR